MKRLLSLMLTLALLTSLPLTTHAEELHGMTAHEIVARMGIGFNLGNTFDATGGAPEDVYSQEQSWGNPIVDAELIKRIADAGFTSIRIPITWYRQMDQDHRINDAFLARIKEVVDMCYEHDLIVIINLHHEAWLNRADLVEEMDDIGEILRQVWGQIGRYFAKYDQRLVFESMNEPRLAGTAIEWTGSKDAYNAVNYLNQVFVETILLETQGNEDRILMIPGYAASSSRACLSAITLPTLNGKTPDNLVISVHSYTPYDFCLSDKQTAFDLNNRQHTGPIDTVFSDLQRLFLDKGVPVVMGETGATNTNNNREARENWAYYFGQKAAAYGVPILIWDNGNNQTSGGECHAWVRRKVNPKLRSQKTPYVFESGIQRLMEGAASVPWGSGREAPEPAPSLMNGYVLWNHAEGQSTPVTVASQPDWYPNSARYAVIFGTEARPYLTVTTAGGEVQVEAAMVQPFLPGKQLAWFERADILGACEPADIQRITVEGGVTLYEFCIIGK